MTFVTVKYRIPGFHSWPDAPDSFKYLRNTHRHEFHFTIWLEVFHDDREVEFIALKEKLYQQTWNFMGGQDFSCEMLGEKIIDYLKYSYPDRAIRVWVEEDGENGSFEEYNRGD